MPCGNFVMMSLAFVAILFAFGGIVLPSETNAVGLWQTQRHFSKQHVSPRKDPAESTITGSADRVNSISGNERPVSEIVVQRNQLREGLVECNTKLGEQTARVQRLEKNLAKVDKSNNGGLKDTLGRSENIKNRVTFGSWNLWFDEKASIMSKNGDVGIRQHEPERKEKVVFFSEKWEGPSSTYATTISYNNSKKQHITRLYYRCYSGEVDISFDQKTCIAESVDGKTFFKPHVNIFADAYNAIIEGVEAHNFAPFIDTNPQAGASMKFKAVGGIDPTVFPYNTPKTDLMRIVKQAKQDVNYQWGLYGFHSADGLKWTKTAKPLISRQGLDSLNVILWSDKNKEYQMFGRFWAKCKDSKYDKCVDQYRRSIFKATSKTFYGEWSPLTELHFSPRYPSTEGLYTNAIISLPFVSDFLIGFPKRFQATRHRVKEHPEPGASDTVIITSNGEGLNWSRQFKEAWLRPGRSTRNWSQRSNMVAAGIRIDKDEWSLYGTMHYQWDDCHMQRLSIRPYGFTSIYGSYEGGSVITTPIRFSEDVVNRLMEINRGSTGGVGKVVLELNYATSAFGSVMVQLLKTDGAGGKVVEVLQSKTMYGDDLNERVTWDNPHGASRSIDNLILQQKRSGYTIFLKFNLEDADVFAWKFDIVKTDSTRDI